MTGFGSLQGKERTNMVREEMAKELTRKKIIHDLFGGEFDDFDERFVGRVMDFGDELVTDILSFLTPKLDEVVKDAPLPEGVTRESVIIKNTKVLRNMLVNVLGNYINIKMELLLDLCNECESEDCILSSMYVKDTVKVKEHNLTGVLGSILRRHQNEDL